MSIAVIRMVPVPATLAAGGEVAVYWKPRQPFKIHHWNPDAERLSKLPLYFVRTMRPVDTRSSAWRR